jgi:hypothetical protein
MQFPDMDTTGDAQADMAKHRAEVEKAKQEATKLLGEI